MTASSSPHAASPPRERPFLALLAVTALVGVGAGLAGTALICVIHLVQHTAYGYDVGRALDTEDFLQGTSAASPHRRVAALAVCGLLAGVGWWAIHRFARPLVSIEEAVRDARPMPPLPTIAHVLLQVVTVGLGSPLGREVAPREAGALYSAWLADRVGFSPAQRRVIVACGAGAGLAAVYNVPFGGALFTLEVLLGTFQLPAVVAAVVSSGVAALIMKVLLHDPRIYELAPFTLGASLLVWSVVSGPIFGVAAIAFRRVAERARAHAPMGGGLIAWCVPTFLGIGVLAIGYPQILGNGKSAAQIGLTGDVTIRLAAVLLLLRFIITTGALRAGAKGGLLTPSLALGALLGAMLGGLWNLAWPRTDMSAFALVGATAFLATSQRMPITAVVLIAEFARIDQDMLFALLLAVGGAVAVQVAMATASKARSFT